MNDTALIEMIDCVAAKDSGWLSLSETEKRQRLDGLEYSERMELQCKFSPMLRLIPKLASITYSLETGDIKGVKAVLAEMSKRDWAEAELYR